MNREGQTIRSFLLDISVDDEYTTAVQVPKWARYAVLFVPDIGNDNVEMQMMESRKVTAALLLASNDTSWADVYDQAEAKVVAASATVEDTWIDISNYIRALPGDCWIRFGTPGVSQGGDLTFKIAFRGA